MANIHIVLQGKGGVGKSMIAAILAQYMLSKGETPICFDTDPVNATFLGYAALNARRIQIMDGDEINSRNFDALIEQIAPSEHPVIIDNGASSFIPLSHYMVSNDVATVLQELGHKLVIHTVVTGGQALTDTLKGLAALLTQFPADSATFITWLNPYWGPIEADGKTFEKMKTYTENKNRISGIVYLPTLKADTHSRDFAEMLQERLTFDEALASPTLHIMVRQRLKIVKAEIFSKLESVAGIL
jgi:hypothetical protein